MPWVRFDDQYPQHPKIGPLSDRLYRLHNTAIFWSARHTTDGVIRAELLTQVRANAKPADAAELVRRRLFHGADDPPCPSPQCPPPGPDGWVIHDYWDYQPSREKVDRERHAKAERQAKWLAARKNGSVDKHVDNPPGVESQDGTRDASLAPPETVTPPPSPPRPEGRRERGSRSRPPAAAAGAVAGDGGGPASTPADERKCPTCGNRLGSAYHRNTCTRLAATA